MITFHVSSQHRAMYDDLEEDEETYVCPSLLVGNLHRMRDCLLLQLQKDLIVCPMYEKLCFL